MTDLQKALDYRNKKKIQDQLGQEVERIVSLETTRTNQDNANAAGATTNFAGKVEVAEGVDIIGQVTVSGTINGVTIDNTILNDSDIGTTVLAPNGDGSALTGIETVTKSATAPTNPSAGDMWFDTTISVTSMKVWNGTVWNLMSNVPFSAIGGTESIDGGYKYHTFNSSGTFKVNSSGPVEIWVIGGGAGGSTTTGSNGSGGGGGAGGLVYVKSYNVYAGITCAVIVGAGGNAGGNGGESSFIEPSKNDNNISATGGISGTTSGRTGTGGAGGTGSVGSTQKDSDSTLYTGAIYGVGGAGGNGGRTAAPGTNGTNGAPGGGGGSSGYADKGETDGGNGDANMFTGGGGAGSRDNGGGSSSNIGVGGSGYFPGGAGGGANVIATNGGGTYGGLAGATGSRRKNNGAGGGAYGGGGGASADGGNNGGEATGGRGGSGVVIVRYAV